jgi:hypothetical protein
MKRIDLSVTGNHGLPWSKEVRTYSEADCLRLHLQREIVQKSQGDHSMYTTICSIIQLMQQLN